MECAAARRLQEAGAIVDEIAFDVSDGRDPYQAWRGARMVAQQFANLSRLPEFGENLRGNVERGLTRLIRSVPSHNYAVELQDLSF
jgi:amidase